MANKTLHSNQITFLDYTDSRKLDVYITSNLPTTQIFNANTSAYTPDWSNTNLQLSADVFLDSKDVTSDANTTIIWYEKIGAETEVQIGTGTSLTISTNKMSGNINIITYICKATYQGITANYRITFNRSDTGINGEDGKDGTSVNILGSFDTVDALTSAHPTGNSGDAYIVNGDLYVWSVDDLSWKNVGKIQGPQGNPGKDAKSIILNADAQVFKISKTNIITPTTISVSAQTFNTSVTNWTYSTNGGKTFLSTPPTGLTRNGDIVTITGSSLTSNMVVIKASDGQYSDTYTIYKVYDGADGVQGDSGDSAPITFLTNENITFSANSQGQIPTAAVTSNIVAYNGTTKMLPTIGEISGIPEGMTIAISTIDASNEIMLTITVEDNATFGSALSNSGSISIPITSPVSTVLSLNWSKINTGLSGEKGNNAVVFQIYSTNGYILSKDVPTITLQTFAYIGDVPIEAGATYQWYKYGENDWEAIADAINPYLEISHSDVSFSCSYMCKMIFNDVEYVGVVTIDDKNDTNTVFTSKPSSYMSGDIWVVGEDYAPAGIEVGTVLRSEHTNNTYNDEDWVMATKYDNKLKNLQDDIDNYNQYFSFNKQDGLVISAKDEDGNLSKFSTSLSNTQLSFNYDNESVAYIGSSKMHIKEAEIESPLTVTGKYSGGTMLQAPTINLGDFSLVVESNGSLSIISNL